jgi:hypothetical protein
MRAASMSCSYAGCIAAALAGLFAVIATVMVYG